MQPNNKPTKEMQQERQSVSGHTIPTSSFEDSRYMAENGFLALLIESGIDVTEIDQDFGQWLRNQG